MEVSKVLITEHYLDKRITQLARQINEDYKGKDLTVIGILKGSIYFLTDLTRKLDLDVSLDFMRVSSYKGKKQTGEVKIKMDLENSIKGKNVLVVEDIIDTGLTLAKLFEYLKIKEPESLKLCVLLDKYECRTEEGIEPDYVGFRIPNKFVIGYGMDVDEKYRNLPTVNCFVDENEDTEKDVEGIRKQLVRK